MMASQPDGRERGLPNNHAAIFLDPEAFTTGLSTWPQNTFLLWYFRDVYRP